MSDSRDGAKKKDDIPMVHETPASASQYPFDQVVVSDSSGSRHLSPPEFFALPLAQRIQYVVEQKAAFFAGGRQIDSKEALGHMRKLRAQVH
jgi:hypothetical protein